MKPIVRGCCCCCCATGVVNGAIAIATTYLVFSMIGLGYSGYALATWGAATHELNTQIEANNDLIASLDTESRNELNKLLGGGGGSGSGGGILQQMMSMLNYYVGTIFGIIIAISIINIVVDALVIHGCNHRKPALLLPFVFLNSFFILVNIVCTIYFTVPMGAGAVIGTLIGNGIFWGMGIFFIIVVVSARAEMQEMDAMAGEVEMDQRRNIQKM